MELNDVRDEIKRRVKIEDVVAQHVVLQRAGSRLRARCPFHEEKTPSFYVNPDLGMYKCFGCGESGDIFSFLMKVEGLSFPEAGERLAERAGLQWHTQAGNEQQRGRGQLLRRANDLATQFFRDLLRSEAGRPGLDYLHGRGFTDETLEAFQLGYAPDSWDALLRHLRSKGIADSLAADAGLVRAREASGFYDVFRNRVMFPIMDVSSRVIGFGGRALSSEDPAKYLNTPETAMFKKGRQVYALNLARPAIVREGTVVVVEGYTDVISLHQAGVGNVVACLGTALTQDHLVLLSRHAEEIILAYDADAAGINAAARNIPMLEACSAEVKIALMPPGLDPDECVKRDGPDAFRALIAKRTTPVEYELELTFSKHRGEGADGMAKAAREAVDVLMRVRDRSRRDEFLARAADRWGEGHPARTETMQRSLHLELRRRLSERPGASGPRAESPRDQGFITEALGRTAADVPPRFARIERELLAAALAKETVARRLCERLQPRDFFVPVHGEIAQTISDHLGSGQPYDAAAVIEASPEGSPARELALTLAFDLRPIKDEELDGGIESLIEFRASGQYMRRHEVPADTEIPAPPPIEDFAELQRRVIAKLNAGEVSDDDPDIVLYKEHTLRSHGSGAGLVA